jgi:hypothetical protein
MQDRRSRVAASILALLTAGSIWLSAGTLAISDGDTGRIAVLPSFWILGVLAAAAIAVAAIAKLRLEHAWPLAIGLVLWLPFLPTPIPTGFLIWQGPLECLIWVLVAAGLLVARGPKVPGLFTAPARAPWIAAMLVAVASLVVFSQVRGVIPGGDEPHYLAATQSLLHDGDLKVANNYAQGDYLDYFPGRLEPHYLVRALGGEIYSIHAPGVSVIVLPAFAVAGYAGAVVMIVLIAALTWRLAFRVSGGDAGSAWVGVAAVFLTTPYFFHTFAIYPEVIGGLCVLAGTWLLFELADGRDVSGRVLIAAGAGLAILPWLHSRFAVLAGILGVLIVARLANRARSLADVSRFLSVPAIAGLAWFAFFYVIWGSASPMAPYGADTSTSASYIVRGLIGLLFDQQFGVVSTAPIYAVAAFGWMILLRRQPRLAIELLLLSVPYAITVASYAMWWAGSAAPARFLVSVLPLAALPIAVAWKEHRSSFLMIVLLASVALILPRAFVESGRFIVNNRGAIDGTLGWLSPLVDLPFALPSVHRDGGADAIRDAAVWLALFVVSATLASTLTKRASRSFGEGGRAIAFAWTSSALAFAVALTSAIGIVGDFQGVAMITPDRSKLAAVSGYRPSIHQTIVALDARRPLGADEFLAAMDIDVASPAVRLNRVPAGDYEVRVTTPPASPGSLAMFVGRNDPPIEAPPLDDLLEGRSSFRLRLPVAVQTLNLMTKDDVGVGASWLRLHPVHVRSSPTGRNALRATRYGHARVFFFDDWAYLERDGFWTRAEGSSTVVIDADDAARLSGLPISVTAGLVPTTVRLSIGGWEESLSLEVGQKREVVLPPPDDGAWTLRIQSGPGFRPSEREPGNRDVRKLAAWIAIH